MRIIQSSRNTETVDLLPPSPFKHQDRIKCTKKAGKNLAASSLHLMKGSIQMSPSMKGTTTTHLRLATGKAVKHRHKVNILPSKSSC